MASTLQRRESRAALAFISPWILGFFIFTAGPMVASLALSFTDYSLVGTTRGVGAANYQELLSDPRVRTSLANTFIYAALYVPLGTAAALGLALLLQRVGRAAGFFRTAFYLPVMTPAVAAGAMFLLLLNGQRGLVNQVLGWVGIGHTEWLSGNPYSVIAALTYGYIPYFILPVYAGLDRIDQRLLEASRDLGASPIKSFFRVTLPLSWPSILAGSVLIVLPMFGDYYTNDLISGSPHTNMLGNSVNLLVQGGSQKNLGAAMVLVLMTILAIGMLYYLWETKRQQEKLAS